MATNRRRESRKRGTIIAQVVVVTSVLVGFAALTVDIGQLYRARSELQAAADSAALAGVSSLATDDMMKVRYGSGEGAQSQVLSGINDRASSFSLLNATLNDATSVEQQAILRGSINLASGTSPLDSSAALVDSNAVEVTVRRSDDSNGPVEFFFASIFGRSTSEASATAVAAFDDRVVGIDFETPGAAGLPISKLESQYYVELTGGSDDYSYNSGSNSVSQTGDGIPEINIYPHPAVPGNFGLLNIGIPNQGLSQLEEQVLNGISDEQMEDETGSATLAFVDETGNEVSFDISGDPGMKTEIRSSLETHIGKVVGFFLHESVSAQGSNSQFDVVDMRYGRLMDIRMTGNPNNRGVFIQPVIYTGSDVVTGDNGRSSGGTVGRIVIVR